MKKDILHIDPGTPGVQDWTCYCGFTSVLISGKGYQFTLVNAYLASPEISRYLRCKICPGAEKYLALLILKNVTL